VSFKNNDKTKKNDTKMNKIHVTRQKVTSDINVELSDQSLQWWLGQKSWSILLHT